MTSLLAKSALEKLPADIRDHVIVERETGYSITLSMTIGDLERLVAPHSSIGPLRSALEEAQREAVEFGMAADEAEAERDDAVRAIDKALGKIQALREAVAGTDIVNDADLAELVEVLEG